MTADRTSAEAECIRDVVHYLNTGELRGVLKGTRVREGLREDLRRDFGLLVRRDLPVPREVLKRFDKPAARVAIRRVRTDPDDRLAFWHHGFKAAEEIACFQALAIYEYQLKPGFPGDLFQCKHCGTFVFSSEVSDPGVRPRSGFCSKKHFEAHQRETGADRKAASRLGIPVEEWRRRKALRETAK